MSVTRKFGCVFCGSRSGNKPVYSQAARALGHALADRGMGLIYGGASVGLMGIVADSALEHGGQVVGVIPRLFSEGRFASEEIAHPELSECVEVPSMHERKRIMAERADFFVALPGGVGTLEELFEIWTWNQLGIVDKPFAILNVDGYYDSLLAFLDQTQSTGFLHEDNRRRLVVDDQPERLIQRLVEASSCSST